MLSVWKTLPFPKYLLPIAPLAVVLYFAGIGSPLLHFAVAGVAILALVIVIGAATEEVAIRLGPVWGGLLNATFGNVTELIIALIALSHGAHQVLRASLTGSILGNMLLLLGVSMVVGGARHKTQTFGRTGASASIGMLALTLFALLIPSVMVFIPALDPALEAFPEGTVENLSLSVSIILLCIYGLHLVFSLVTHRFTYRTDEGAHEEPRWSLGAAIGTLVTTVVLVALCSDVFVASIDQMLDAGTLPMSEMFVGVVVVAVVGNAAEGSVAIVAAAKNKMELAFQVAMSSAIQIALLVAPLLVMASYFIGPMPLTLVFNPFELLAIWAGVLIASFTLQDGESNWFEGAMLVAVYVAFAVVFWVHPDSGLHVQPP